MNLFSVGEEVIIQSKANPQLNGDAVILEILNTQQLQHRLSRFFPQFIWEFKGVAQVGYILNIETPERFHDGWDLMLPKGCSPWAESALRKKYKPGEDFETIMGKLKTGVYES